MKTPTDNGGGIGWFSRLMFAAFPMDVHLFWLRHNPRPASSKRRGARRA